MKVKRFAVLLLALALLLPTAVSASESSDIISSQWKTITGDDFVVDTLNGVNAYPSRQCNELAIRYYEEVYGVDIFVGVYSPFLTDRSFSITFASTDEIPDLGDIPDEYSGFQKADSPKVGDIVYWSMARRNKNYAHTALVKDYSNGVITLIEQNWNSGGKAVYERKIRFPSDSYVVYTLPPQPEPTLPVAYASTNSVYVDGSPVEFEAYALRDENGNDTNYIKLRDVAYVLDGSAAQFNVDWDGSIVVTTGVPYSTPNGSEMKHVFSGDQPYERSGGRLFLNGADTWLDAITLTDSSGGQHTYIRLRTMGEAFGFDVSWSNVQGAIIIDTTREYDPAN